jgi:hypothetical protein
VTFIVEDNKVINPVHIGLFSTVGIVLETDNIAKPIQNLFGSLNHRKV